MAKGTIRRLMDRGYGFIKTEQGEDFFFHGNDVENLSWVRDEMVVPKQLM